MSTDLSTEVSARQIRAMKTPHSANTSLFRILSTLNAGKTAPGKADYAEYQGTSMAAPHVAGIVALMKAVDPKLTYAQAKKALQSTSQGVECDQSACGSAGPLRP